MIKVQLEISLSSPHVKKSLVKLVACVKSYEVGHGSTVIDDRRSGQKRPYIAITTFA
jgi:hypothetical protein